MLKEPLIPLSGVSAVGSSSGALMKSELDVVTANVMSGCDVCVDGETTGTDGDPPSELGKNVCMKTSCG